MANRVDGVLETERDYMLAWKEGSCGESTDQVKSQPRITTPVTSQVARAAPC